MGNRRRYDSIYDCDENYGNDRDYGYVDNGCYNRCDNGRDNGYCYDVRNKKVRKGIREINEGVRDIREGLKDIMQCIKEPEKKCRY